MLQMEQKKYSPDGANFAPDGAKFAPPCEYFFLTLFIFDFY